METLDRLASFRSTYIAIALFLIAYVFSVQLLETGLNFYFRASVASALNVNPADGPILGQLQSRANAIAHDSRWVHPGGVKIQVLIQGADGTPIYLGGLPVPPPETLGPAENYRQATRLLPAVAQVRAFVPHNSLVANLLLVAFAGTLIQILFLRNRRLARFEQEQLQEAFVARESSAERSAKIESELMNVRNRLEATRTESSQHAEEIGELRQERSTLQEKLASLAEREEELLSQAVQNIDLEDERHSLEELLDESLQDLAKRDDEIQELESNLKHATRGGAGSSRPRDAEHLTRRLRTLYKNLEFDDRIISDLVALRDETMKLKAEESIKRLSDEADNLGVRRKVGGLPSHLTIFELGFGGKGRIYFMRSKEQKFRILAIGAKNSQNADLDYLRRL